MRMLKEPGFRASGLPGLESLLVASFHGLAFYDLGQPKFFSQESCWSRGLEHAGLILLLMSREWRNGSVW